MQRELREVREKGPDEETILRLEELEGENKALKQELALCPMCHRICTPAAHSRLLQDLLSNKTKRDNFLKSLGKNQKQVLLRTHFLQESTKHVAGFDGKTTTIQSKLELKQEEIIRGDASDEECVDKE